MAAPLASSSTLAPTIIHAFRNHAADATALIGDGDEISYADMWRRVAARVGELRLPRRSLVALLGDNSIEFVVTYLALLDDGHVPMLVASEQHVARLVDRWSPAAVVRVVDGRVDVCRVDVERAADDTAASSELHPDLAILLSTSGSTGSPKLVRLSHRNLVENARSIVEYLALDEFDRGVTSLPLHYCYGLSVLHSHLLAGAGVVVTDLSVVDPCFLDGLRQFGVTNVAGVPHTFEMLERSDPERLALPALRLLTQAGGRLAPDVVERWLDRAERWGAEFVVMYGQTEATARMGYLPPHLARRRPGAIGVAIPGGRLHLRPIDTGDGVGDDGLVAAGDVGELVYSGPNVMMGYAEQPDDLARGAEIDELRTGDLARFHTDDGVFEIVGRRARFVKPFGLRIDLDEVETRVRPTAAADVAVAGDDRGLRVVAPGADRARVLAAVLHSTSLPAASVVVVTHGDIPRTESGKVDYAAVVALTSADASTTDLSGDTAADDPVASVASVEAVFASVLGSGVIDPEATFVSLGGDSLSYVECSIRLERSLGRLPTDWHLRTVAELAACRASDGATGRRLTRLDTTVLLRATGICLVVATHMRLRHQPGGAHLMLAVVGYNVARFLVPIERRSDRIRAGVRTVARVAVPTMLWVAIGMAVVGSYSWGTLLLVNNYAGPASHAGDHWHFWFIEVFVHVVLIATVLLAVPAVGRLERRRPYAFAIALLAGTVALRLGWSHMGDWYNLRFRTHGVAWFFALGWLVHRSSTRWQRIATTVLCAASITGFFRDSARESIIAGGLILLLWMPSIAFPNIGVRLAGALASASMWIYISHFTFWPLLDDTLDLRRDVAYVSTIAIGVAIWAAAERLEPVVISATRRFIESIRTSLGLPDTHRSAGRERRPLITSGPLT